jgi:threonylcarbamoyladenosine tRNA methylthiotransferase MtaB
LAVLYNLGCKLNQYEGYCLREKYAGDEDVIILNTCCVTREAEARSIRRFRYLARKFSEKKIIATGCTCRLLPHEFSNAHLIIDNVRRNDIIKGIFPLPDRSRFFVKIQDGCNGKCSYCVVPYVRDRIVSKPCARIREEIDWARKCGFNEIVLVGANIGLYGLDRGSSLTALARELGSVPDLPRIRLSSIEPTFITRGLVSALKDLPLCRHFHVPVQSADDEILRVMNRGYTRRDLAEKIDLLEMSFPGAGLGADVITGFPGEDNARYRNTYRFIQEHPFMHLHVFPYSPRPVTKAYGLGDPVSAAEKKKRLWELKGLIRDKNRAFRQSMLGKTYLVTVEKKKDRLYGLTDTYVRVLINEGEEKELRAVRITEVSDRETAGVVMAHG